MASKTIWIINQAGGSAYHGMVYRHYYIGKEWVKQGHKVIMISASFFHTYTKLPVTTGTFTKENIDGIEYWWVEMPKYSQFSKFSRLFSLFYFALKLFAFPIFQVAKPDTIIVSGPPHIPIINGWIWSKIFRSKLIYEVRDIWPLTIIKLAKISSLHPVIMMMRMIELFAYEVSDKVVSVLALANRHFEDSGMEGDKFVYIPNGVDIQEQDLVSGDVSRALSKLGEDKRLVVYAGSMGFANNLDQLIETAEILKENLKIHFVMVGDGPHKKDLVKRASHLQNVTFFDAVPKKEIPEILSLADIGYVGLMKSDLFRFGVSPNKLFDYMAASLPVLMAIDTEDSIVEKARCGKVIPSCAPRDIAQAINELMPLDDSQLDELGRNGRKYLEEHHTFQALSLRYIKAIDSIRKKSTFPFKLGVLTSLALSLFFAVLFKGIPDFLPDQIRFHLESKEVFLHGWKAWSLHPNGQFPVGILSAIYLVFNHTWLWLSWPIYGLCCGLSFYLLVQNFRELGIKDKWWVKFSLPFLLITPTTLVWWVYPHKDTFIFPAVLLICLGVLRNAKKVSVSGLFCALIGFIVVYLNKQYFLQIFFAGTLVAIVILFRKSKGRILLAGMALAFSLIGSGQGEGVENYDKNRSKVQEESWLKREDQVLQEWVGLSIPFIDIPLKRMSYTRERFLQAYGHGSSSYHPELLLDSTVKAIKYIPHALVLAFAEPLPWREPTGNTMLKKVLWHILQIEMLMSYLFYLIIILRWRKIKKSKGIFLLCIAFPFLFALGFAVPNIGSINRYRWPFLFLVKLVAIEQIWNWWKIKIPDRRKPILLFHGPDDLTFVIQRLVMAKALEAEGYEIHVACPDTGHAKKITELGFQWHSIDLNRGGLNPVNDLKPFIQLLRLLRQLKPNVLQNISIKPVIYGSLASGIVGLPKVINLINGLGYAFEGKGLKGKLVMRIAKMLYRVALNQDSLLVIFQNPDDQKLLVTSGIVQGSQTALIRGSGVDQEKFKALPLPHNQKPRVVFISRLIWSKGVGELAQAVKNLKSEGLDFEWVIVGVPDDRNPDSVPLATLEEWQKSGVANWLGRQTDMPKIYAESDIVCLPSYYREGVPLTLLEAASCGRPLVAADSPGTREPVEDGVNGFLVKPRDVKTLTDALRKLLKDEQLRKEMGAASSEIVTKHFSSARVQEQLLNVYNGL